MAHPLPDIDVTASIGHLQIQRQVAMAKNIEVVMLLLLNFLAPRQEKLFVLALELLFVLHVIDSASSTPELSNAHAEIRVQPRKEPLAQAAVEESL